MLTYHLKLVKYCVCCHFRYMYAYQSGYVKGSLWSTEPANVYSRKRKDSYRMDLPSQTGRAPSSSLEPGASKAQSHL